MRLLTVQETARLLRVTPQFVYRLARTGTLPVVRIGRQVRVEEDALEQWIAERTSDGRLAAPQARRG